VLPCLSSCFREQQVLRWILFHHFIAVHFNHQILLAFSIVGISVSLINLSCNHICHGYIERLSRSIKKLQTGQRNFGLLSRTYHWNTMHLKRLHIPTMSPGCTTTVFNSLGPTKLSSEFEKIRWLWIVILFLLAYYLDTFIVQQYFLIIPRVRHSWTRDFDTNIHFII